MKPYFSLPQQWQIKFSEITISGNLDAVKSTIESITSSGNLNLSGSHVNTIIASGGSSFAQSSNIYLKNNTTVNSITFKDGTQGKVFVSKDSKIVGSVTGGTIENQ